ncbi:hypothetical protein QZH41_002505 [Actinostola sp. cb2023]|nr:hypothetical protein QZH41_002505 [Actinostola sp. cb2023]
MGSAVGLKTGKVVSFATRNTMCRICQEANRENRQPRSHDCRRNREGSSKSMEANAAVQLFSEAVQHGVKYSTYVGDDDSTTESRLKALVNYDIEKWSDINHSCRTLGSRLYSAKKKVIGLTPVVIGYIQKCFTFCIKQNKGQPSSLLEGLSLIVPHAFGDHSKCKEWCKYSSDPENYHHTDLPGGKDLKGDDLRACIEDALHPFLSDKAAQKMVPVGSSQRNECLNSIVGSKAPKIRHYGGSEISDFRTAAGVAQFNEGYQYIIEATEEMGLAANSTTEKYVCRMDDKRHKDRHRKSSKTYKKARRQLKKNKTRKTSAQESHEGVTYKTGIGLSQTAKDSAAITNGTLDDIRTSTTEKEFHSYANALGEQCRLEKNEDPTNVTEGESGRVFVLFDTETTGLDRCSEIIQIACITHCGSHQFSKYLLPVLKNISDSASRVNGLSIQYRNGQKVLVKDGHTLETVSEGTGLIEFCDFIRREQLSRQVVLVAHNGNTFDFQILFNALKRHELLDDFLSLDVMLLDSLKLFAQEMKRKHGPLSSCPSKSVSGLYEFLFKEQFKAHDALEDSIALARILFKSKLSLENKLIENCVTSAAFERDMKRAVEVRSRKCTLEKLPASNFMKKKLGKEGLDNNTLITIHKLGGVRGLLSILALPKMSRTLKCIKLDETFKTSSFMP